MYTLCSVSYRSKATLRTGIIQFLWAPDPWLGCHLDLLSLGNHEPLMCISAKRFWEGPGGTGSRDSYVYVYISLEKQMCT